MTNAATLLPTLVLRPYSFTVLPPGSWRPYGEASAFNTRVSASPELASESAKWIEKLKPRLEGAVGAGGAPSFNTETGEEDYNHPVFFAKPGDPTHPIKLLETEYGTDYMSGLILPCPQGAEPAGGTDGHFTIVDQSNFVEYDFWQVKSGTVGATGSPIEASWGGFQPVGGSGIAEHAPAADAAGFGLAAGLIRGEELTAGSINHALFMISQHTFGIVSPAIGSANPQTEGWPPMGGHMWLDSTPTEIAALGVPKWQELILLALHEYGAYIGDRGGGLFKTIGPTTYSSPGLVNPFLTYGEAHSSGEGITVFEGNAFYEMRSIMKTLVAGGHFHFLK